MKHTNCENFMDLFRRVWTEWKSNIALRLLWDRYCNNFQWKLIHNINVDTSFTNICSKVYNSVVDEMWIWCHPSDNSIMSPRTILCPQDSFNSPGETIWLHFQNRGQVSAFEVRVFFESLINNNTVVLSDIENHDILGSCVLQIIRIQLMST
jgi:hypothetical protein